MHRQSLTMLFLITIFASIITACASGGDTGYSVPTARSKAPGKITKCKSGDKRITSSAQCLQDDAACYALNDGGWCTGPRGLTCPSGSRALKSGENCPSGSRCFSPGESLNCVIDTN